MFVSNRAALARRDKEIADLRHAAEERDAAHAAAIATRDAGHAAAIAARDAAHIAAIAVCNATHAAAMDRLRREVAVSTRHASEQLIEPIERPRLLCARPRRPKSLQSPARARRIRAGCLLRPRWTGKKYPGSPRS